MRRKARLTTLQERRDKEAVRVITRRLILAGIIVKPERCEGCDLETRWLSAYHPYPKDAERVEWVCPHCLAQRRVQLVKQYIAARPVVQKPLVTPIRAHRCVRCIQERHGECQRPGPAAGLPQDDRCRCACQRSPEPGKYVEPPNAQRVGKVPGQPSFKTLSTQSRKHRCLVCKSGNHGACVGYSGEGIFGTKCRCECRRVVKAQSTT